MSRGVEQRVDSVRHLLEVVRAVDPAPLVPEIVRATGLSPEGVALGFRDHLERDASDEQLRSLVHAAGDAARVHVILSANVFVAAFRAIAIARAASDRVTVRPSRRDPAFARALVAAAACPEIQLGEDVAPMDVTEGEIHVYGRDETIARVRAAARHGVRVRGHGAGMGVAWIDEGASVERAARDLASDVVPFDQRGCLSPRIALVSGDESRARDFGRALHEQLSQSAEEIPRGMLSPEEMAEAARYASTMAFAGKVFSAADHLVAVALAGAPLAVPPPGRHVHVACVADEKSAAIVLAPLARFVVTIGTAGGQPSISFAPPHARVSPLGRMQRPPLDGPVDLRADGMLAARHHH